MILFVFEGVNREPDIFKTLEQLFFIHPSGMNEKILTYPYGTSFHTLYNVLNKENISLLEHLRDKAKNNRNNKLRKYYDVFLEYMEMDFSEIFLFFDYDFHIKNMPLDRWNEELDRMLLMFDNETENGKMYISYPMVESIRYTKKLPDPQYYTYWVKQEDCMKVSGNPKTGFKFSAAEFSYYNGLSFIQLNDDNRTEVEENWQYLKEQNVSKANYICTGKNEMPTHKEDVAQKVIFKNQLENFVRQPNCGVSILNAFPLFLYDYFK